MLHQDELDEIFSARDTRQLFTVVLGNANFTDFSKVFWTFLQTTVANSKNLTLTVPFSDLKPLVEPFVHIFDQYAPPSLKHTAVFESVQCVQIIRECLANIEHDFKNASLWTVSQNSNPRKIGFVCSSMHKTILVPQKINSKTVVGKIAHEVFVHAFRKIAQTSNYQSSQVGYKTLEEGIATALEQYLNHHRDNSMQISIGAYSHRIILYALLTTGYSLADCIALFEIYHRYTFNPQISLRNLFSRVFKGVDFETPSDLLLAPNLHINPATIIYYRGVKRAQYVAQNYPPEILTQLPFRKWDPSLHQET